ncbi:hypothetical protein [Pengzhenrongella sp.]|jgi:hypothetical protein|uniref:hypothetical protein n=1 Tax=Pengzhenrongella sp. TaxID=2888820 RepID=UPI002F923D08
MDPLYPRNILDAIDDAQTIWTYHRGDLDGDDHLADLAEHTTRLVRALSRLEVLAVTHPHLSVEDAIPRGAVGGAEIADWLDASDMVRSLVESPEKPREMRVAVRVPQDAPDGAAAVLSQLDGQKLPVRLVALANGTTSYELDLTAAVEEIVDGLMQSAIDPVGAGQDDEDDHYEVDPDDDPAGHSDRVRELRRRMRMGD